MRVEPGYSRFRSFLIRYACVVSRESEPEALPDRTGWAALFLAATLVTVAQACEWAVRALIPGLVEKTDEEAERGLPEDTSRGFTGRLASVGAPCHCIACQTRATMAPQAANN